MTTGRARMMLWPCWPSTLTLVALGLLLPLTGCKDEAYCFRDCGKAASVEPGNGGAAGGPSSGELDLEGGSSPGPGLDLDDDVSAGGSNCDPGAEELCDGTDNDCDGEVDESINFSSVRTCGDCETDCTVLLANVVDPVCVPPDETDGSSHGTCEFETCAQDYYNLDDDEPGCEYYCDENPLGENDIDLGGDNACGRDDDCDGTIDEDVDTCTDTENCGRCGKRCVILHGTARCASSADDGEACTEENTECAIDLCEAGHWDANGSPSDGCEYRCEATGPELCDGADNDCDGLIDNTDPDLEDAPTIGESCQGGAEGVCVDSAHAGVNKCIGGQIACCDEASSTDRGTSTSLPETGLRNGLCESESGIQVVRPGSRAETCNGVDDDCDGAVDNAATDAGSICGTDVGACTAGTLVCSGAGEVVCQGATSPGTESCNGIDDDCDGVVDGTIVTPTVTCTSHTGCDAGQHCALQTSTGATVCATSTSEVGLLCDVPPVVTGGVSACQAGATICSTAGQVVCEGSVTRPSSTSDSCGVDENCDGILNATDLEAVTSCGTCENDCTSTSTNTDWRCEDPDGEGLRCVSNGCYPGWVDLVAGDDDACDSYCIPLGEELCNGEDDDCDGDVDEAADIAAPSAATLRAICGVPSTIRPGCTPALACNAGDWVCSFADPDICGGSVADCASADDSDCDDKDNDCNGIIDDAFVNEKGVACTRGDVTTCITEGMLACDSNGTALECDAPDPTATAEICDGEDNDCDGYVDEAFTDTEGASDGEFVRPNVVALSDTGPWVFAYEASRPDATSTSQGSGNGYVWSAPTGEGLDQARPCSAEGKLPWTNVSANEVEQSCARMGGRICRLGEWRTLCRGSCGTDDYFGFLQCETVADYDSGPYCNLDGFDVDSSADGDQDSLIDTRSSELADCASPWEGSFSNTLDAYDTTGNAREFARCAKDRAVCSDQASCLGNAECCSGASTDTDAGPTNAQRLCGSLGSSDRRLSGQPCTSNAHCCNSDANCSADGVCEGDGSGVTGICGESSGTTCVAIGTPCSDTDADGNCEEYGGDAYPCCNGAPILGGFCGGQWSTPHATYPLLGGSYRTTSEDGATCDYDFFKVGGTFRLFDSGFRCCFDTDPRL